MKIEKVKKDRFKAMIKQAAKSCHTVHACDK